MRKIKSLDNFDSLDEAAYVPKKAQVRFEISKNLKSVAKMEKALIDMLQMITEMNDDIMKLNFNELDADSIQKLNDMRAILKTMTRGLKKQDEGWAKSGLMSNTVRLRSKLEGLKEGVLLKK
jgi:hypothetical protein